MKLDDQRAMNLKLRKAGFEASGLDVAAICQVSSDGTDGFISVETVEMLAGAYRCKGWRKLAEKLVEVGRWIPTDDRGEPGWFIHDFLKYNPTKAEWEELVANRQAAGRRGGQASAEARAQASAEANGKAQREPKAQPVSLRPPVKGGRNVKDPRVGDRPVENLPPKDPDAGSKMRAAMAEAEARFKK